MVRVRDNLFHAQVIENGVHREATLQSEWPVLFPVEMHRPSMIRTAEVARCLYDSVGECVNICLPLSQAIKLPENIIIGGLDNDSPRSKDVNAASSVQAMNTCEAFEIEGVSFAVITDPNDGKVRRVICVHREGNDSLFTNSDHLVNSTNIHQLDYEQYGTYPPDWILAQFKALGSPWPDLYC